MKKPLAPTPVSAEVEAAPAPLSDGGVTKKKQLMYPAVFEDMEPPKQLWRSRAIGDMEITSVRGKKSKGVLHVCGRGSKTPDVVFISPCVLYEEEMTSYSSEPKLLKGPAGNIFLRALYRCGFKDEEWYYTALCKYSVPRSKLTAQDIRWNAAMLDDELRTLKPKLIVCLGKPAFDYLFKLKFKLKDVQGGFFRSEEYDCMLYPMDSLITVLMKPEYLERMLVDLKEVRKSLNEIKGVPIIKVATNYTVLDNAEKLQNAMTELGEEVNAGRIHVASVDCEWKGQTAWSGQLRSIQACWKPGQAVYLRLMAPKDGKSIYVFDQPLPVVREIIDPTLNNPKLKYVGHNFHADMAWMDQHLDIDVRDRAAFDTMFAQQLLNEYADLKLERLSVQHTDLGRYDIELLLWKKKSKFDEEDNEGYGLVPDGIIIPYACRDVDATLRIYPILMRQLVLNKLSTYYFNYALPFVTDGFYELMSTGIPIDREYLDEMRTVFTRNGDMLLTEFRKDLRKEADMFLHTALRHMATKMGTSLESASNTFIEMYQLSKDESPHVEKELRVLLQAYCRDSSDFDQILPLYQHWRVASKFNISSSDHLGRWLFEVKRFKPIKTTKKDGIQMAWDKVMSLPAERQSQFRPAADKQTIKVFATKDPMVSRIEELKSVQNITKIFLKGPDEEGREQGLHKWIQPDGRVHANFAVTETGRPRAWKPNILNWPKHITKPIEKAFERINVIRGNVRRAELMTENASEEVIAQAVKDLITLPVSVRSGAKAPDGYCLVDMDLMTAEVVGLGYLSGDQNLIKVLTEPDSQYARIDKELPKKSVRICYNENVKIPVSKQDPKYLVSLDDPRLLRDEQGQILHPRRDVHWEFAEEVAEGPRESLEERLFRDGCGKVGNFSIPYGATDMLLERMIEANTGIKPPEGTGKKMIEAHAARYPVATNYQKYLETTIESPGYFRALSGRVRHFYYTNLGDIDGLSDYTREGILSPLKRQARNFPMQNIVADTTAKALVRFVRERRERKLDARIMMLLYDAMTVITKLEDLKETITLLKNCLTIWCPWTAHGVTFNFDVDTSIGFRWGVKATKEEKAIIAQYL